MPPAKQLPVPSTSLDDYTDLVQDAEAPHWVTFYAQNSERTPCRLLVFTPEISANPNFRSAWRRDVELFRRLHHDGLPQLLESGDDDGIVFVASEQPSVIALDEYVTSHSVTWDEAADLGWQAASVIQHLHNFGLAHGGLDSQSFRVSEQLRVSLVDIGAARWVLAASDAESAVNLSGQYREDLLSLARLVRRLASASGANESSEIPPHWCELIADLADEQSARFPSTAREFQGRLGGILLEESGDEMVVVADRSAPGQTGRSIVDELLDTPLTSDAAGDSPQPTSMSPRWIAICAGCLIAALIVAAGVALILQHRG